MENPAIFFSLLCFLLCVLKVLLDIRKLLENATEEKKRIDEANREWLLEQTKTPEDEVEVINSMTSTQLDSEKLNVFKVYSFVEESNHSYWYFIKAYETYGEAFTAAAVINKPTILVSSDCQEYFEAALKGHLKYKDSFLDMSKPAYIPRIFASLDNCERYFTIVDPSEPKDLPSKMSDPLYFS